MKRALDITCAITGLLALFPLLCLVALFIAFDSAGPVIFRQKRGGLDGLSFTIFKFRTMYFQEVDSGQQAVRNDPRITRVGRILRQTSIDELPQLFNVLKGDMSLIGPRPHTLAEDKKFGALVEDYSRRSKVRPGLSGWAQVKGLRGETPRVEQMQSRVEHDLWYVDNWSLWLDIRIIVLTLI